MKHVLQTPETCKFKQADPVAHESENCYVCDGGLKICAVCGMAEADLLDHPECPGPRNSTVADDELQPTVAFKQSLIRDFAGLPANSPELLSTSERTKATTDYLLTCVAEECAEVSKEAAKGIRFGLHDQWQDKPTAHDALITEYYDLVSVMEMLFEAGILRRPSNEEAENLISRKRGRVRHFMKYSANRGHYKGEMV